MARWWGPRSVWSGTAGCWALRVWDTSSRAGTRRRNMVAPGWRSPKWYRRNPAFGKECGSAAPAAGIPVPRVPRRQAPVQPQRIAVLHVVAVMANGLEHHHRTGGGAGGAVPDVGGLGIDRPAADHLDRKPLLVKRSQHVLALGVEPALIQDR